MINISIIGGAGYTGGELLRILIHHPDCKIVSVHSRSHSGKPVTDIHTDLMGDINLYFSHEYELDVDIIFLCLGHGESEVFLKKHHLSKHVRLIDLSQDFRYKKTSDYSFVYGLPEFNRLHIMNAKHVANPGCFATAIELALLPLAREKLLTEDVHVSGITGSTGAGQLFTETSHFSWRSSNISLYKPFVHQHLYEITQTLEILQNHPLPDLRFLPFRGNFSRGILTSIYTKIEMSAEDLSVLFKDYYDSHPFVVMSESNPDLKQVLNTNKAILNLHKEGDISLIVCVIDNLVKGASGQAVQNMNLMLGLDETSGLKLKSVGY